MLGQDSHTELQKWSIARLVWQGPMPLQTAVQRWQVLHCMHGVAKPVQQMPAARAECTNLRPSQRRPKVWRPLKKFPAKYQGMDIVVLPRVELAVRVCAGLACEPACQARGFATGQPKLVQAASLNWVVKQGLGVFREALPDTHLQQHCCSRVQGEGTARQLCRHLCHQFKPGSQRHGAEHGFP
jgi:hypothetical protein